MDAFELLDKVKAFDVEQAVEVAFSSDAFLRSVEGEQLKQMRAGKNADGKRIGKYRNKAYAKKKNEMNLSDFYFHGFLLFSFYLP